MKKLIFAAMAVLCFSAQAKKTIISGRVDNWEGVAGTLVMNFCDPLGEEDRRAVELKKTGGEFRFEHDYAYMQSVTMALGGQFVVFPVTPGGSIEMTIDARTGNAEFAGDGAKLSREINDWSHSAKLPMDVDREGDLRAGLATNFAAAKALIDASGMSREARRWALLDHKFGVANSFIGGGGDWELFADPALFGDVWATWCGPCQGEFSVTGPMHDYFEGNDVVFVNICGQCELDTWLPTMERWGVHGENYFLGEDATTMLLGEYNLPGFPSYMIIDRAGNLHNPAPRPSNLDGTIKEIEELL